MGDMVLWRFRVDPPSVTTPPNRNASWCQHFRQQMPPTLSPHRLSFRGNPAGSHPILGHNICCASRTVCTTTKRKKMKKNPKFYPLYACLPCLSSMPFMIISSSNQYSISIGIKRVAQTNRFVYWLFYLNS